MNSKNFLLLILVCLFAWGCREKKVEPQATPLTDSSTQVKEPVPAPVPEPETPKAYALISKDSLKSIIKDYTKADLAKIAAINRVDVNLLPSRDSIIIPSDLGLPENAYFPFPDTVSFLAPVNKFIVFSYPAQAFAAYENGRLVQTGPTSMGKKSTKTPLGLFYTNWKSKESVSTSNDEWILKWNFNVHNRIGVGFHQYQLPGYPASHSCMRLRMEDAEKLYYWADQWILKDSGRSVAYYGTPVLIYGAYPWGGRKPWYNLADNADILKITEEQLRAELPEDKMQQIMERQQLRMEYAASKDSTGIAM